MAAPRRKNVLLQEPFRLLIEHAQVTSDTTTKVYKVPTGRKLRIDRVLYVNPTGLAQDAANYFAVQVKKGSTVMASHSTQTGAQGTLTADTFVELVLSATDANRVADAGDEITMVLDETGTATLPAGKLVLEGRIL